MVITAFKDFLRKKRDLNGFNQAQNHDHSLKAFVFECVMNLKCGSSNERHVLHSINLWVCVRGQIG